MSFKEELMEFYRLMGTKGFWRMADHQRLGALTGLWMSGVATGCRNQDLLTVTAEYDRRQELIWRR